ncbi:MAG TPA: hypothetical protein VKT82_03520 [Ktedonobacterales bacterium]|nr:hypothetical protein [Ktedonobacterales bacterium]
MGNQPGFTFACASRSLVDLLTQARQLLAEHANDHATQRGQTRSANNVLLTWQAPQTLESVGPKWTAAEAQWYLFTFVKKQAETDPLNTDTANVLLFPYTYAARTRFWDAGWAHLCVLVAAIRQHDIALARMYQEKPYFTEALALLGEHLHLQTVLSLLALYPPPILAQFVRQPDLAETMARAWRADLLQSAIDDLASNPHSRRAIVSSFCYPHLEDKLSPQMSKPPYQLFQLLPADADAPLSSIHEHRSLDLVGGAQLDFLHDLSWLAEANQTLHRPIGDISIVAHNLHEYQSLLPAEMGEQGENATEIEQWLCSVTDGYRAGLGVPQLLLKQPTYATNAERIYHLAASGI